MKTTSKFWDCECEEWYIHSAEEVECSLCGARREDQPDSRVDEVWAIFDIDGAILTEHPWNMVVRDNVMAEWEEVGEGLHGEYNPDDPDDVELLRFYVSYHNGDGRLITPQDSSYCTLMPVSATPRERRLGLERILDAIDGHFPDGSYKRALERMSWMEPRWFIGEAV